MSTQSNDHLNDIAIISMEARLPGADNIEAYWRNLCAGVESVRFLSNEPPVIQNGFGHVKAVPMLDGMELFDAGFFGFNPREAETMDPQVRLFMECAWTALERAGYDSKQTTARIGVFAGCATSTYLLSNLFSNPDVMRSAGGSFSSLGQFNDRDCLSTIVSYKMDLTGPSVTVQTFCSTSLVGLHLACQSLLNGESDMALAGGASINVSSSQGYVYQEGGIVSRDGHCRTFDEKASGTVFGNGVGVVLLKRLADALEDGDTIHAVIRGSAINNDGDQKAGYTAPSVVGQSKAIAEAIALAQVPAESIRYIEAHGTATALGDPIEVEALGRAFRTSTQKKQFCAIGSVKTNFGHLDRAAGVAALIKTALILERGQIPPSLHFERPNPKIDFDNSPFFVNTQLRPWPADARPRRAGVSALGVGGTNAHVVLEEPPPAPHSAPPNRPEQLLVLSARTETALAQATRNLAEHLRQNPQVALADVAYTLQLGRRRFEHRRAVAGSDVASVIKALESPQAATGYAQATSRPVVFMFPGQGAQYVQMTAGLYRGEAVFREHLDDCCTRLTPELGFDLRTVLFDETASEQASARLQQTAVTQPALFAVEYALAKLWMSWGIQPQALIGHSIGEYVAACLAGVFSLPEALSLVACRGRWMQELPAGDMLAVPMSEAELQPLVREPLALAAVNGPALCVVSGPADAVAALQSSLEAQGRGGRLLHTSHAFHSAMMDPILERFKDKVRAVTRSAPRLPLVSNLTGTWLTAEQAADPEYWAQHLRRTVRFADGLNTLWREPDRILLEVGPGTTLTTLARQAGGGGAAGTRVAVPSIRHPQDAQSDVEFLLGALGRLWIAGAAVDWKALHRGSTRRRVQLPTYPFERQRFWIDPAKPRPDAARHRGVLMKHPDPGRWFYVPAWTSTLVPQTAPDSSAWLMFIGEPGSLGAALADHAAAQGRTVIRVRAGTTFGGDPAQGFSINPAQPADYARMLEAVRGAELAVSTIIHAWNTGQARGSLDLEVFNAAQQRGYYSLLHLARAIDAAHWTDDLRLKVVANNLLGVLPGDVVHPELATMLALCKVIPQELHQVTCTAIDVQAGSSAARGLEMLTAELAAAEQGAVVAHRQGQRWVQRYEAVELAEPAGLPPRLRPRGVYLITGGLGGVGFALARYLAQQCQARLVMVGRSALPPPEQWPGWLQRHRSHEPTSQRILRAQALEELGAEVMTVSADAGNLEQLRQAIVQAEHRFGRIDGVIHAAGILERKTFRPVHELGAAESEAQFYPKVAGLLALDQALADRPLDFCMLTSSLSSVLGGFAYGAYAAANVFMDAYTREHNRGPAARWISVNWDEWRLTESADGDGEGGPESLARLAMSAAEGAAAFGRILGLQGADQVVVSTGDLHLRIDQWIKLEALRKGRERQDSAETRERHARPSIQSTYVAPSTPGERKIAEIWQDLLGIDKVGIHDNFFELGGHSLLAIQVVSRIKAEFEAEVSVATLFEGPTVHSLSKLISADGSADASFEQSTDRGRKRKEKRLDRIAQKGARTP